MSEDHKTLSFYNLKSGSQIVVERRILWLKLIFIIVYTLMIKIFIFKSMIIWMSGYYNISLKKCYVACKFDSLHTGNDWNIL
jgi:hypothetical protein